MKMAHIMHQSLIASFIALASVVITGCESAVPETGKSKAGTSVVGSDQTSRIQGTYRYVKRLRGASHVTVNTITNVFRGEKSGTGSYTHHGTHVLNSNCSHWVGVNGQGVSFPRSYLVHYEVPFSWRLVGDDVLIDYHPIKIYSRCPPAIGSDSYLHEGWKKGIQAGELKEYKISNFSKAGLKNGGIFMKRVK